ncbi:MAG TPA: DNA topoisomerase, partial [Lachnospiraceae bacterium]|nr:DNA topoisomerase [Lachnospiraceae bacterium]
FPIDNYCNYDSASERLLCICSMEELLQKKILFVTRSGMGKIVSGSEYDVRTRTSAATRLGEGDEVLYTGLLGDGMQIVLWSEGGYFLRFEADEIPMKKKAAVGVRLMRLSDTDCLEGV